MQRFIGLMLLLCSMSVSAEQSLHKRIDLQDQVISQVYVSGFITLELTQNSQQSVEIYWRKNSVDQLKVGIEENEQNKLLFIKAVDRGSVESWDKTPIAHVIVNLNKLSQLTAHHAHWLAVENFTDQALALEITGESRVTFNNLNYQNLVGQIKHTATLVVRDSQIKMNQFRGYGAPKILFQNHTAEMINVGLFDHARMSIENSNTASLYLSGTYKTQMRLNKQSSADFVALYASVDALMELQDSQVKTADVKVTHNGKVNLGNVEVLTVNGLNQGMVSYQGKAIVKTDLKDKAQVKAVGL
ncbi:hypothetical protein DS2_17632 [Catenovulum agarivorans DS-2]|uniref:Putative auto-transporter adhesin head GIN domain-containing protein n=1 Tax=Catenovulum agarivorans DS-2 TaxID=1328313 RepID=W7Q8Q6_9ALTE|nr:DUF2807 domain-containing protein [Catenovulum agarivorans]EWH08386.1 hypothetical protein DS2_17632 [Catenovulum agarivorans DS-2]